MRSNAVLRSTPFASLTLFALVSLTGFARADTSAVGSEVDAKASPSIASDGARDSRVARLLAAKTTLKWNYAVAGRPGRYGHAEALVNAPAQKVVETASDFGHYHELHRKFASARVIAKEGGTTDVYMRYPVQIGPMRLEFYEVMRFGQPHGDDAQRVIEARAVKGDMKDGQTVITVKPIDATHALLAVDILLVPKAPAPQSLVDEELRDGAQDFVNGVKDRAQGWVGPVTTL
jgi:hypothetical protein